MDWKIEVIVVPVTDVDEAKRFYTEQMGFALDVDHAAGEHFRVVQVTPPGSACSITFGINVGAGEPGSVKGIHLCVDDIEAAHEELTAKGVATGGIKHFGPTGQMEDGPHPERADYGSYIFLEAGPDRSSLHHDRRRAGMNHVALWAGSRAELDRLVKASDRHGWSLLFADRHPFAGGPNHYAAYLENREGFEVELVAQPEREQ